MLTETMYLEAVRRNSVVMEYILDKDIFYKVAKELNIEVV
jgi:energy-converting hydrogenase A subunit M